MFAALFIVVQIVQQTPGTGAAPEPPGAEVHPGLCEASAAVEVQPGRYLIADNETRDRLFAARIGDDGRFVPDGLVQMPNKRRPRDIEALARWGTTVVAVGSFSRRKDCSVNARRARLRGLHYDATSQRLEERWFIDAHKALTRAHRSIGGCLDALFGFVPPADPSGAGASPPEGAFAVCAALNAQRDCPETNIEGAVFDDTGHLWLGLRAPLVGGRAVLLRAAPISPDAPRLRFDAVARFDLAGRGIRELTRVGPTLWVIAGPPQDEATPTAYRLHRLPAIALVPGARLEDAARPIEVTRLPPHAEGLILEDGASTPPNGHVPSGWVLTDGDGKDGVCRVRSTATRLK